MHMMCKTGTVCLGVADPHFIFDRISVRTIRTHICRLLMSELALSLKQVLSLCPTPLLPPLLGGGYMQINSTYGSTIDTPKYWVVVMKGFVIRVNNSPPPPLCTPHHEPIVGVIYRLFSEIILEISLGLRLPSDALVGQPDIDYIHRKNRQIEPLRPIFSTQIFLCQDFLGGTYCAYQFGHMRCNGALMWLTVGWSDQPYWYLNLGQVPLVSILCECTAALSPFIPQ